MDAIFNNCYEDGYPWRTFVARASTVPSMCLRSSAVASDTRPSCPTGLPLVFSEEIWLDHDPPYAVLPADAPAADLDGLVA